MFCEKCGAKNNKDAKFCEKCGHQLEEEKKVKKKEPNKTSNNLKEKISNIPKKVKYGAVTLFLLLLTAIIILCILLSNPVKKVEDNLTSFYNNYKEDYDNKELIEIGKILKNNKEKEDVLENIEKQADKTINNWVKNFNTSYKDSDELEETYKRISGMLASIYKYYNGLEYMLDYESYYDYSDELYSTYYSKVYYFKGLDEEDYDKYSYFSKVIEDDSYYNEAQEFIASYVEEELNELKSELDKLVTLKEDATNEEKLEALITKIKFLNEHKIKNKVDLSATAAFQDLYNEIASDIVETVKDIVEVLDKDKDYKAAIETIENTMDVLDEESDAYEELSKLKDSYKDKMPVSLLTKYTVSETSNTSASNYKKTINDKEYDSNISFRFNGETGSRVYRLNEEYKTLKMAIVRGEDWDKSFSGYFVITGDDKELYKSKEITKSSELDADITVDVTGVDDLKIEFITESKPEGWDSFYIYLVEPYLYK